MIRPPEVMPTSPRAGPNFFVRVSVAYGLAALLAYLGAGIIVTPNFPIFRDAPLAKWLRPSGWGLILLWLLPVVALFAGGIWSSLAARRGRRILTAVSVIIALPAAYYVSLLWADIGVKLPPPPTAMSSHSAIIVDKSGKDLSLNLYVRTGMSRPKFVCEFDDDSPLTFSIIWSRDGNLLVVSRKGDHGLTARAAYDFATGDFVGGSLNEIMISLQKGRAACERVNAVADRIINQHGGLSTSRWSANDILKQRHLVFIFPEPNR